MTWDIGVRENGPHKSTVRGGRTVRTYKRKYLVRTDGDIPTESDVAAALGIYQGSPYPNDTNAIVSDVDIDQLPTRPPFVAFHVDVTWSTDAELPENTDPETASDPTTMRVKWSVRTVTQTTYITNDRNGNLITNTAGTPYDGGVPVTTYKGQAIARRNKSAVGYDKGAVMRRSGKVNDDTYLGAAAGKLCVEMTAEEVHEGSWHYWAEEFTFTYDQDGINPRVASCGFFCRKPGAGADGPIVRITDSVVNYPDPGTDTNMPEPEPLDADGFIVPIPNRPEDCAFVTVDHYEAIDFDAFGL